MTENFQKILDEYEKAKLDMQKPEILTNPNKLIQLSVQFKNLEAKAKLIEKLQKINAAINEAQDTLSNETDQELLTLSEEELSSNIKASFISMVKQPLFLYIIFNILRKLKR